VFIDSFQDMIEWFYSCGIPLKILWGRFSRTYLSLNELLWKHLTLFVWDCETLIDQPNELRARYTESIVP